MDERRIEQALRQGPPDEPAYERSIAAQVQAASADLPHDAESATTYRGAVRRAGVAPRFGFATALAAAVVLAVAAVVVRLPATDGPGASTPTDLLGRLQAEGTVRIAVTSDPPQTTAAGGAVIGFDVDVARELAKSLRLHGEISVVAPAEILGGRGGEWAIGLPSRGSVVGSVVTAGPAYYAWPSWLVTSATSAITTAAELNGATICVVIGTAGQGWLRGQAASEDKGFEPPAGAVALERASDAECVEAIRSGQAAAAVTAQLLDDELAGKGLRALVANPAVKERRVDRGARKRIRRRDPADGPRSGPARSGDLAAVLSDASRRAFGGRDLTEGTP